MPSSLSACQLQKSKELNGEKILRYLGTFVESRRDADEMNGRVAFDLDMS